MSMTDPISDMLSRIRNGQMAGKATVNVPTSGVKRSILEVLTAEGYINGYSDVAEAQHPTLVVELKYVGGKPVISEIDRVSKPGLRKYAKSKKVPAHRNGLGITIITTSKGVMTDTQAREQNVGGEILCRVF